MNLAQIALAAANTMKPGEQGCWVVSDDNPKPTETDLARVRMDLLQRNPDLAPVRITQSSRAITIVSKPTA